MYKELNSDIVKFVKFSPYRDKTLGLNVVQSCCTRFSYLRSCSHVRASKSFSIRYISVSPILEAFFFFFCRGKNSLVAQCIFQSKSARYFWIAIRPVGLNTFSANLLITITAGGDHYFHRSSALPYVRPSPNQFSSENSDRYWHYYGSG